MTTIIFILVVIVLIGALAVPIVFLRIRKRIRERKNFERGLKMVPLLIHLPPPSEDIEANGRDTRDVTEENISRAQIIYGIIASTIQKGFKAKFYGQRHFAFEIIASKGFVYFYAAVPVSMAEVVKQAVVSAYPTARLEEVAEHNIFNPVGKLSGVVGGEMSLKEPYAYPIATYQDMKRDAMQALLNALSTLDKEDGAGIQILMRPADPVWRKNAISVASTKRKGEGGKKGAEKLFGLSKEVATAFVKPPESKDAKSDPKNDLSGLDQSIISSIEEKTQNPGYEVLIRIIVSSNISQRSQAILNNIIAAFSLYDAPGKNGFKFSPTKDVDEFTTSYILRMFPQKTNKCILNSVELATIFHFPEQKSIPTSQLERQGSKQVDAPRNMPDEGLLLGYNVFRGVKKPVRLSLGDRQRHMYTVGQTGTGKSTYLENLALQDMLSGGGFAFVDPHGDTAERLLAMVPKERTEDIIYFSPSDVDYPMGLNLFEHQSPDEKDFLIQEVLNMLYKLYDPQHQGIMGPRYEHLFRNAALTVMADPAGGTFVDIPKLFRDPAYVKQKLQYVKDQNVIEFWQKEMPQSQRSNEFGEVVSWFVSKFGAFLSNEMMRNIIGQTKSAFKLRDVMDEGKILIVNLSKGRLGMLNSQLLGMIFVMKFQAAAMSRANIPESDRKDFALYVDEFQNFSTDSFATILSEARKYHLNLIVANQFTTQLTEEIRDAVFGNTGTIVAFRVGQDEDAEALSKRMRPAFDASDLLRMPNYNAAVRMLVKGVPTQPFSMATLPPLGNPNYKLAEALKQLSAAKYGRPKALVEKEIFARLATKVEPKPPARQFSGGASTLGPAPAQNRFGPPKPGMQFGKPPVAPPAPGTGSFLDEWMTKRESKGPLLRPNPWGKAKPMEALSPPPAKPLPQSLKESSIGSLPRTQPSTLAQPVATKMAPVAELPVNPQVQYGVSATGQVDSATLQKDMETAARTAETKLQGPVAKPEIEHDTSENASGEIPLSGTKRAGNEKDTIFIDPDGNLHMR
ncbi:MAG TPA: TraM recognition domain-containing protein [Candidatus Saccharimonadales bacterium]|nr:TraM recognition domain-containing protein [Candidatus Saccharimonadales bacterium]